MRGSKKEKIFINIFANLILLGVLVSVFVFSFSNSIITVLEDDVKKPYYRGETENKNVSLMFNVYWGTEYLDGILQTLDKYNVKTTFFLGGMWVVQNGEMAKKIYDAGHEIANHGYFHKDHKKIDVEKNKLEILNTEKVIQGLLGVKTNLFAPPSGSFSNTTLEICEELGYKVIMWSKDTIDWRDKDKYIVYKRATKDVMNGDLILMHPTKHTLGALDDILAHYKTNAFKVVTVSQNIGVV